MSLETRLNRELFEGNGVTKVFPFSFKVWETDQLKVFIGKRRSSPVDVTDECTVTINDAAGGVVTFSEPPKKGTFVAVCRHMPFIQEDRYISGTRFDPHEIEDRFDQDCGERQELLDGLDRALKVPETSDMTGDELLQSIYDAADSSRDFSVDSSVAAKIAMDAADRARTPAEIVHSPVDIQTALATMTGIIDAGAGDLDMFYKSRTQFGSFSRMPFVSLNFNPDATWNSYGYMDGYYSEWDLPTEIDKPVLIIIAGASNASRLYSKGISPISAVDVRNWTGFAWRRLSAAGDGRSVGGIEPAIAQAVAQGRHRTVFVVNCTYPGSNCSLFPTEGGTWGPTGDIREKALKKIQSAIDAMPCEFSLGPVFFLIGTNDARAIYDGRETIEQHKAALADTFAWFRDSIKVPEWDADGKIIKDAVLDDAGNPVMDDNGMPLYRPRYHDVAIPILSAKIGYMTQTKYDATVDAVNAAQVEVRSAFVGVCRSVSNRALTFRDAGMLVDSVHHNQAACDLLGDDIGTAMCEYIAEGTKVVQNTRDPFAIDDPVLVGAPWGFSKSRYLPGVGFTINAQQIFASFNPDDRTWKGYGRIFDADAEAKWQGNTTLTTAKKSFTIKLSRKSDIEFLPGWGKRKKYVVKNNVPNNGLTNILCARLWGDVVRSRMSSLAYLDTGYVDADLTAKLTGLPQCGCVDGFPVTYAINGSYYGLGTFNLPKEDKLLGMNEDDETRSEFFFTAGSNQRQAWQVTLNAAKQYYDSLEAGTNPTRAGLLAAMVGSYDSASGLLGRYISTITAASRYVFPTFANKLRNGFAYYADDRNFDITDSVSNWEGFAARVRTRLIESIDAGLEEYKRPFVELIDRSEYGTSVTSSMGWNARHDRCASAAFLRDTLMENVDGIANAFALCLRSLYQNTRDPWAVDTSLFVFSEGDATLFQAAPKCVDDGFELEACTTGKKASAVAALSDIIAYVTDDAHSMDAVAGRIELSSAIDLMICILLWQDIDQLRNNYFLATYDGGAKWFMTPYDMNQSFISGGAGFNTVPAHELSIGIPELKSNALYRRILETPATLAVFKARYFELRSDIMSDWAVSARMLNLEKSIAPQAYEAEVRRWPMYGYTSAVWDSNAVVDRFRMQAAILDKTISNL